MMLISLRDLRPPLDQMARTPLDPIDGRAAHLEAFGVIRMMWAAASAPRHKAAVA
jgi:hypothetical protein